MKTKITTTDGRIIMGARNLFHDHAPQFSTRLMPDLPTRIQAKATGEKTLWYEVTHSENKTILTAE